MNTGYRIDCNSQITERVFSIQPDAALMRCVSDRVDSGTSLSLDL